VRGSETLIPDKATLGRESEALKIEIPLFDRDWAIGVEPGRIKDTLPPKLGLSVPGEYFCLGSEKQPANKNGARAGCHGGRAGGCRIEKMFPISSAVKTSSWSWSN
jgi:hypothetical protein